MPWINLEFDWPGGAVMRGFIPVHKTIFNLGRLTLTQVSRSIPTIYVCWGNNIETAKVDAES